MKDIPSRSRPKTEAERKFLGAMLAHGWHLLGEGRDQEAMDLAKRLVRYRKREDVKGFFVQCIKRWSYFPGVEDLQDVIVRALVEAWTKPSRLFAISRGILDHNPVVGPAIQRAERAWPERLSVVELLGPNGLHAVAPNRLLHAVLECDKVIWPDFEHFLTSLRAGLLKLAAERPPPDEEVIGLCCALARQSILNEYVWDETSEEKITIEHLIRDVSSGPSNTTAMELAVLMSYVTFDRLPSEIRNRSWPESVSAVLTDAAREKLITKRNASAVRRLTPISDKTSVAVQEQYEQNPYPRWVKIPPPPSSLE